MKQSRQSRLTGFDLTDYVSKPKMSLQRIIAYGGSVMILDIIIGINRPGGNAGHSFLNESSVATRLSQLMCQHGYFGEDESVSSPKLMSRKTLGISPGVHISLNLILEEKVASSMVHAKSFVPHQLVLQAFEEFSNMLIQHFGGSLRVHVEVSVKVIDAQGVVDVSSERIFTLDLTLHSQAARV